jgi:branched-chain amino acid transport system substrate-binding protein
MKIVFWCLAAAMMCLAVPRGASAADTLEIPTVLPLTGPAAFLGKAYGETLKALEDRINKAGGIGGRPIHFAIQDDQTSPQLDLQLTTAALAAKPALVVDGAPLAMCRASLPLMTNGPVMWCLSPSLHPEPGSYAYSVMASSHDSIIAALNYYKGRGYKKIGVLNGTDATGSDGDAIIADAMKQPAYAGLTIVAQEHFNPTDISVAAQIARIKSSGAQAMVAFTTGTPLATVLRGMSDAGLDIPVFTSQGNMSVAQLDGYRAFVPKELLFPGYPVVTPESVGDAGVREKVDAFRSEMKADNYTPDLLHATPWDVGLLMAETFRKLGPNATAQQLRDAFNAVKNWPGAFGRYDFPANPGRGLGLNWVIIARWDAAHSTWSAASKGGGEPLK